MKMISKTIYLILLFCLSISCKSDLDDIKSLKDLGCKLEKIEYEYFNSNLGKHIDFTTYYYNSDNQLHMVISNELGIPYRVIRTAKFEYDSIDRIIRWKNWS